MYHMFIAERNNNFSIIVENQYFITIHCKRTSTVLYYCQFNKLTSVFYAFVLLLIMNFVITLSK